MGILYGKEVWLMSDLSKLAFLVFAAGFMNVVKELQKKRDPVPVIIANLALFFALGIVGGLWRYDFSKGLAALYLLASFIANGADFTNSVIRFVTGFASTAGRQ